MDEKDKAALITAIVSAVGAIIVAVINKVPASYLEKQKSKRSDSISRPQATATDNAILGWSIFSAVYMIVALIKWGNTPLKELPALILFMVIILASFLLSLGFAVTVIREKFRNRTNIVSLSLCLLVALIIIFNEKWH